LEGPFPGVRHRGACRSSTHCLCVAPPQRIRSLWFWGPPDPTVAVWLPQIHFSTHTPFLYSIFLSFCMLSFSLLSLCLRRSLSLSLPLSLSLSLPLSLSLSLSHTHTHTYTV